jgi:HPt (histidine-containing phosphotransfer) domain-containing protein
VKRTNSMPEQPGDLLASVPMDLKLLIPGFLERRETEVSEMKELLNQGDYQSIGHIAHKLKGNGAGFGLQYITDLGRELEAACFAQDVERVRNVIEELKLFVSDVKDKLNAEKN